MWDVGYYSGDNIYGWFCSKYDTEHPLEFHTKCEAWSTCYAAPKHCMNRALPCSKYSGVKTRNVKRQNVDFNSLQDYIILSVKTIALISICCAGARPLSERKYNNLNFLLKSFANRLQNTLPFCELNVFVVVIESWDKTPSLVNDLSMSGFILGCIQWKYQ